jgi:hypothetical protein
MKITISPQQFDAFFSESESFRSFVYENIQTTESSKGLDYYRNYIRLNFNNRGQKIPAIKWLRDALQADMQQSQLFKDAGYLFKDAGYEVYKSDYTGQYDILTLASAKKFVEASMAS